MQVSEISNLTIFADKQTLRLDKKFAVIFGGNGLGKTSLSRFLNKISTDPKPNYDFSLLKSISSNDEISYQIFDDDNHEVSTYPFVVFNKDYIDSLFSKAQFSDNKISRGNVSQTSLEFQEKTVYFSAKAEYDSNLLARQKADDDLFVNIDAEVVKGKKAVDASRMSTLSADLLKTQEGRAQIADLPSKDEESKLFEKCKKLASVKEGFSFPVINFDSTHFDDLLARILSDLAHTEDVAKIDLVNSLLEGKRDWVRQGLSLIKDDKCPFCGNEITKNDLVAQYKQYFASKQAITLSDLKNGCDELSLLVRPLLQEVADSYATFAESESLIEDFQAFEAQYKNIRGNINSLPDKINGWYSQKASAFAATDLAEAETLQTLKDLKNLVLLANKEAQSANTVLEHSKKLLSESRSLYFQKVVLPKIKADTESDFRKYIDEHQALKSSEAALIPLKKAFEDGLKNRDPVIKQVNETLISLGFERYRINENFDLIREKDSKNISGNYSKMLSDGEKSVVAFALFASEIELGIYPLAKIFVVDDPVSSVDYDHIYNIYYLLKNLLQENRKFLILTHNYFFMDCLSYGAKENSQFFELIEGPDKKTIIKAKNPDNSLYMEKLAKIRELSDRSDPFSSAEIALIPNYCRYIIETLGIFLFPKSSEPINSVITRIEEENTNLGKKNSELFVSKNNLSVFVGAIQKGSHSTVESALDRERSPEKTYKSICNLTIKIVKLLAPGQL
jgi:wobble nucleotide-excising tRNase